MFQTTDRFSEDKENMRSDRSDPVEEVRKSDIALRDKLSKEQETLRVSSYWALILISVPSGNQPQFCINAICVHICIVFSSKRIYINITQCVLHISTFNLLVLLIKPIYIS
ncbi:hypothetical protein DPMN_179569 [Dreissena polymorpha]|uniref:Uncharacterized protein n=1 Tax=Dreissena polymorpha TaxID=45954 RepID=A0A9D4IJP4_DREPO|nr:hypothetical protein DPMN_179569 [Dreissena polymorpha]